MLRMETICWKLLTIKGTVAQTLIKPYRGKPQQQKNNKPEHIQNAGFFFKSIDLEFLKSSRK